MGVRQLMDDYAGYILFPYRNPRQWHFHEALHDALQRTLVPGHPGYWDVLQPLSYQLTSDRWSARELETCLISLDGHTLTAVGLAERVGYSPEKETYWSHEV